MTLEIRPVTATIGAEVHGIDLADVSDDEVQELRKAWLDWKVLFFRDQHITRDQHRDFGRRFGELEIHPFAPAMDGYPEFVVIESDHESQYAAANWHSDVTWRLEPSLGSILRGVEIPAAGGDTCFANAEVAYDRLPDDVKGRVDGLVAVHDFSKVFGRNREPEFVEQKRREHPPAHHPVIRAHPETGTKCIYTNRAFVTHIDGMSEAESDEIVGLLEQAIQDPSVQCRFRWEPDSFAMWDNRCTQHYATDDFWPERRRVERVTIIGDRPC